MPCIFTEFGVFDAAYEISPIATGASGGWPFDRYALRVTGNRERQTDRVAGSHIEEHPETKRRAGLCAGDVKSSGVRKYPVNTALNRFELA